MIIEVWIDIMDYDGVYQLSNYGIIRKVIGLKKPKIIKPVYWGKYACVRLTKNSERKKFLVHRLMGIHFFNITDDYVINHIDEDKTNNSIYNLEVVNVRENTTFSIRKETLTSTYTGVYSKFYKGVFYKWGSCITVDNKKVHLGYFDSEKEAHESYLKALKEYGLENKYATKSQDLS